MFGLLILKRSSIIDWPRYRSAHIPSLPGTIHRPSDTSRLRMRLARVSGAALPRRDRLSGQLDLRRQRRDNNRLIPEYHDQSTLGVDHVGRWYRYW